MHTEYRMETQYGPWGKFVSSDTTQHPRDAVQGQLSRPNFVGSSMTIFFPTLCFRPALLHPSSSLIRNVMSLSSRTSRPDSLCERDSCANFSVSLCKDERNAQSRQVVRIIYTDKSCTQRASRILPCNQEGTVCT